MAFEYKPFINPYIGSISELMGKGDQAKAEALLRIGEIQARAAEQQGQAWGNAIQGLGNLASKTITDYNSPEARRQREIDKGNAILKAKSLEQKQYEAQRVARGNLVPGRDELQFIPATTGSNPFDAPFRNVNFGPRVTTDETFALAQAGSNGEIIENALPNEGLRNALSRGNVFGPTEGVLGVPPQVAQPDALSRGMQGALGTTEMRRTLPTGRPDRIETYKQEAVGRYVTVEGLYDVKTAYRDLVKAGISNEVATNLAKQGLEANTIFSMADDLAEKSRKSQVAVAGSIANLALQAHAANPTVSLEDTVKSLQGPSGNRIPQDQLDKFEVAFFGKLPQEQESILRSMVQQWDAQGKGQAFAPGSIVRGEFSGNQEQVGTAPVSAADQLFSQNLRDYKKAVINGSTESSYANWLASEGRAPDKLTPNELALDSFAQSLGKKDRSSLTDADFQKYAKRQNLANDDPQMAMLRDLSIAAYQDKALTAQQVRDDAAAFNRLPTNVQNAASTIGLRMPSDVARNNLSRQLARAPDEASQLRLLRVAIIPTGEAGIRYASRQATIDALDVIQSTLAELRITPGASVEGPLSGNLEKIAKAFGTSRNTKYQELGARIGNALINYRKGITGAAFSPEEAKGYKALFSDYTNTPALTDAILSGFRSALKDDVISNYKMFLGGDESAESLARVLAEPNISSRKNPFVTPNVSSRKNPFSGD